MWERQGSRTLGSRLPGSAARQAASLATSRAYPITPIVCKWVVDSQPAAHAFSSAVKLVAFSFFSGNGKHTFLKERKMLAVSAVSSLGIL